MPLRRGARQAIPAEGRIPEVQKSIEVFYRGRGFIGARVAPTIVETHNPDRASLVFDIQAGTRARVGVLEVDGVDGADRNALLSEIDTRVGAAYDADVIQRGLERFEGDLRERGYYEARATHTVTFDSGGSARVTVIVTRGPLVTVAFDGDPLPEDERDRLVPIRTEASVDEDLLEDSALAIEEYLRARGYRDAVVAYTRNPSGDELRLTFTVTRGRRYFVDGVTFDGNRSLSLAEVEAALAIKPESPFVQESLDTGVGALRALYRSRGFSRPTFGR